MSEGKSVRSQGVGSARGVCGVARLGRGINHARRRAPCIRSLAEPTRLTWNTQTGSLPDLRSESVRTTMAWIVATE